MLIIQPGKISSNVHFVGDRLICNFVVMGKNRLILLDAGVTISALILEKQIRRLETESARLTAIWLSHSHYDHVGSIPYLTARFPIREIAAHPVAKQVLENPKAVRFVQNLMEQSEKRHTDKIRLPAEAKFRAFEISKIFSDGEMVDLENGVTIQVIFAPGHTRDSVAFYILPDKLLYSGDGLGVPTPTGFIQAEFLSNYHDYLDSLLRLQKMDIKILALPHAGVIVGKTNVQKHFEDSIAEAHDLRERIRIYLTKFDGNVEKVTHQITLEDYEKHQIMQPKEAFLINLEAMVVRTERDLF